MGRKTINLNEEDFVILNEIRIKKGMNWNIFMKKVNNWLLDYFRKEQSFSQGIHKSREIAKNEVGAEYEQLIAYNAELQTKVNNLRELIDRKNKDIAYLEKKMDENLE